VTGQALLAEAGRALHVARNLRYSKPETFDDVTSEDLDVAARHLRAISYSCQEGARLFDRIRAGRQ